MRTGGTSLGLMLRRIFQADRVYPAQQLDQSEIFAYTLPALLVESWPERCHTTDVVLGHFPLWVTETLGVQFTTLTLLRSPVERTLSFLRDLSIHDAQFRDCTLDRIYADPVLQQNGLVTNHMVRMLALQQEELPYGVAGYFLRRSNIIGPGTTREPIQCRREHLQSARRQRCRVSMS